MKINRFRGDTIDIKMTLKQRVEGKVSIFPLTDVDTVTMAIDKSGTIVTLAGTKGTNLSGEVSFPVSISVASDVGEFPYDVEVIFDNGKKATFVKNIIVFRDDVNK